MREREVELKMDRIYATLGLDIESEFFNIGTLAYKDI